MDFLRYKEIESSRTEFEERARTLGAKAAAKEALASGIERELKVEREWRTSLQEASISNIEKISLLHQEVDQLKAVSEASLTFYKY